MNLSYQNKTAWFKLLQLLIFFALYPSANIYSVVEIPYVSDFEIAGSELPASWTTTNNSATITNEEFYSGTRSVRITSAEPENIVSLDFNRPADSILFVDYYAQLTASDLPSLPLLTTPETTAFVKVRSNGSGSGEWAFLDGDGSGNGTWITAGDPVDLVNSNNTRTGWHRITLRLDLNSNSWDVYIDGQLLAVNLGFAESMSSGSEAINIYGSSTGTDYLDTFSLTTLNPLYSDNDKDGISDFFETIYGLNTSIDDRDLDPDSDGRTNIEEYLYGTDPSQSNIVTVSLPAGTTLTEVNEANGNLEVIVDGSTHFSGPLNEISVLDINGANSSNNIDILLNGTLNGSLKIKNITGNVTFKSTLNINGDLDIRGVNNVLLNNGSVNVINGSAYVSTIGEIRLENSSSLAVNSSTADDYFIMQPRQNLALVDSSISSNIRLFMQVIESLHLIRSTIQVQNESNQLVTFNHIILEESNLITNNGDLYAQINGNLTVDNRSQLMVTEGNIGLNIIGNALFERSSQLEVKNSTVSEKKLQLIVSGSTTFDSGSTLAAQDAELNIFSFGNINFYNSFLTILFENVPNDDSFIRTNANLTLTNSTFSTNNCNLSVNAAQSLNSLGSDVLIVDGNLYLNMRIDLFLDINSTLSVTGGELYANVFGDATLGGIVNLDELFAMYVQGNFMLSKDGSLDALTVYLSSNNDIAIAGRMNTSKVDGKVYLVAQNLIDMRESEYPITSELLSAIANNGIFLRTEVDSLTVQALATGAEIEVYEEDNVTVENAYNPNGSINLVAGGNITLVDVTTDDLTVTENNAATYTVTFDLGNYGTRTGGGALTQTVSNGDSATAPAVSGIPGWSFTGWDTEINNITSNVTISAQYAPGPSGNFVDADSDDIPDSWEIVWFGSLDENRSDDFDQDGIPNIFEVYNGSNPSDPASIPNFENGSTSYVRVDPSKEEEANTFATITEAAAAAQNGNYTIIEVVQPGIYTEDTISLSFPTLLIAPQGSQQTVLRSTNSTEKALNILDLCVLDGFTIPYTDQNPPLNLDSPERIVLKDCSISRVGVNLKLTNGGGTSSSGGIVDIINCYMPEAAE